MQRLVRELKYQEQCCRERIAQGTEMVYDERDAKELREAIKILEGLKSEKKTDDNVGGIADTAGRM